MKSGPVNRDVLAALTRTSVIKKQLRAVANEVRKEARRLAPRETGTLKRGIGVDNVLDDQGQVEFRVGWTHAAWYGALVELGTEDTPARAHLRPAAIKVAGTNGRRPG